jgi:hypothetical protein
MNKAWNWILLTGQWTIIFLSLKIHSIMKYCLNLTQIKLSISYLKIYSKYTKIYISMVFYVLQNVQSTEKRRQEAIHRLITVEMDFIDLMHAGIQRYSRPLRHCILSQLQHSTLFQNVEKVSFVNCRELKLTDLLILQCIRVVSLWSFELMELYNVWKLIKDKM